MRLFYKKRRFFAGNKQVDKIIGSQIVQISEINTAKLKTEVVNKGYNISTIFIGILVLCMIPMYQMTQGNFKLNYKFLFFIPIVGWAIYDLFIKPKKSNKGISQDTPEDTTNLLNVTTFNSFLKTIVTPENVKIKYSEIRHIRVPYNGKETLNLASYKYEYLAYLEFNSGEKLIILGDNDFQKLSEAAAFLARSAKIRLAH